MALHERMVLSDGELGTDNFDSYPILRQGRAPEVEIALLQDPSHPPVGAGEPALAPTPAAVANAVFAATGERIRRLPIALGG